MKLDPRFLQAGDQSVIVEFGDEINLIANQCVHELVAAIDGSEVLGLVDVVPSYRSLLVNYDVRITSRVDLQRTLSQFILEAGNRSAARKRIIHIPTLYGGDYGPDLDMLSETVSMSPDDVVQIHSTQEYLVYMIGFTPGFPYLGGLDKRIKAVRRKSPRSHVPAGSVGIAEEQTGVYPINSPGGWNIIGRTPLLLFDPTRKNPSLITSGDYVVFTPLEDEAEYLKLQKEVKIDEYVLNTVTENV